MPLGIIVSGVDRGIGQLSSTGCKVGILTNETKYCGQCRRRMIPFEPTIRFLLCIIVCQNSECTSWSSLVPRLLCGGGEKRAWYTLLCMHQVPLVTCILSLLRYTKITVNSVYLLKGRTAWLYSRFDVNCLHWFIQSDQ